MDRTVKDTISYILLKEGGKKGIKNLHSPKGAGWAGGGGAGFRTGCSNLHSLPY